MNEYVAISISSFFCLKILRLREQPDLKDPKNLIGWSHFLVLKKFCRSVFTLKTHILINCLKTARQYLHEVRI